MTRKWLKEQVQELDEFMEVMEEAAADIRKSHEEDLAEMRNLWYDAQTQVELLTEELAQLRSKSTNSDGML